jgi:hypothetical protein
VEEIREAPSWHRYDLARRLHVFVYWIDFLNVSFLAVRGESIRIQLRTD